MAVAGQTVLEQFREQGYVVIPGLLDRDKDIQPVHAEYEDVLDGLLDGLHLDAPERRQYASLPFLDRMARFVAETGPAYYNHFQIRLPYEVITEDTPIHLGPAIFDLLRSPRLLDGIELFIGPEISCNPLNVIRLKPPQQLLPKGTEHAGVSRAPWHQDIVNFPVEAEDTELLTVWLPLTDATVEMGCLEVVPGSHLGGNLETHCPPQNVDPKLQMLAGGGIPDKLIDPGETVPIPIVAGDVLFMTRFTKHGSLVNVSNKLRWSFDLRYHPTHQFSGQPERPSWVARSRARPETEVTDHRVWAAMWRETQARLTESGEIPTSLRYDFENPICGPS